MKRLPWTVFALSAAVLLAGCGEIANTLAPPAGTENILTVALDASPNFTHVGIFEAQALGYFRQTDLKVRFITPQDPLEAIAAGRAQVAISNEPAIILLRNTHISVTSVAAILQGSGRVEVNCATVTASSRTKPKPGRAASAGSTTASSTTAISTPRSHSPLHPARCTAHVVTQPDPRYQSAPAYSRLDFAVSQNEIVNHAPIVRRFIQAVGRGYAAARADPQSATENLVKVNPSLHYTEQLVGVRASIPEFFPAKTLTTSHPWGWQSVPAWNAFGTWLFKHELITDINAPPGADTNELLAGQGI